MKWTRFTIHTTVEAVDILSYELDAIGVEGIEIEDHIPLSEEDKQKMFVDILPEPAVVDDVARVSFYIEINDENTERTEDGKGDADDLSGKSIDEILQQVQGILDDIGTYTDIGEGRVTVSTTEDKDWINNWKQYFKPFRASDRIAIVPRWIDIPGNSTGADSNTAAEISGDVSEKANEPGVSNGMDELFQPAPNQTEPPHILRIDPGIAFGTGSHETTKLCIRAIDRFIQKGDRVLDIGTGSGILSIVSLLLGASFATAIDIDEIAVRVARENFDANDIDPNSYELLAGNLLGDAEFVNTIENESRNGATATAGQAAADGGSVPETAHSNGAAATTGQTAADGGSISETAHPGYDLVIANILPDVIVPLTAIVPRFLKKNGLYITSGILATREREVRNAMEAAGFTDIETTPMGEWVSLTGCHSPS